MDMNKLYQEISDTETVESSEGFGLDPIQVGQVCAIYNRKIKEITGIDLEAVLDKHNLPEEEQQG